MFSSMMMRASMVLSACCSNPCQNGASCRPLELNQFYCECTEYWTGDLCHRPVVPQPLKMESDALTHSMAALAQNTGSVCEQFTVAQWLAKLRTVYTVTRVEFTNNTDCCNEWLENIDVKLGYDVTGASNASNMRYCPRNVSRADLEESAEFSCHLGATEQNESVPQFSPPSQVPCEVKVFGTEHPDGACASNPCENNGTCSVTSNDSFICDCKFGSSGITCASAGPPAHALCRYECERIPEGVYTECTPLERHGNYDVMHMTGVPENWMIEKVFARLIIHGNVSTQHGESTKLVRFSDGDMSIATRWSLSDQPPVFRWSCVTLSGRLERYPSRLFELHIHLLDINDHAPLANLASNLTLSEATNSGEQLWKVNLTDNDPTNGWFNVSVVGSNQNTFGYDPVLQRIILLENVDYEATKTLNFTIHVEDGHPVIAAPNTYIVGLPHIQKRSTDVTFFVTVTNVNDERPKFTHDVYSAFIEPNSQLDDVVNTTHVIRAIDDSEYPLNYSLLDINKSWDRASNYYSIDETTGLVRHVENAYRRGSVMLAIKACETEIKTNCAYAMLNITARNKDMKIRPEFSRYVYEAHVSENVSVGDNLVFVRVRNADKYPYLQYHLNRELQSPSDFVVDGETGAIHARVALDYETENEHTFTVYASDGDYTTSAVVRILVKDYNEFAPSFALEDYTFNAERVFGRTVGRVNFTDGDVRSTPVLLVKEYGHLFRVNQSGHVIMLADPNSYRHNEYSFTLTLLDNVPPKKQATTRIVVRFSHFSEVKEVTSGIDITQLAYVVIGACILIAIFVVVYTRLKRNKSTPTRTKQLKRLTSPKKGLATTFKQEDIKQLPRVPESPTEPPVTNNRDLATASVSRVDTTLTSFVSVAQFAPVEPLLNEAEVNYDNASVPSVSQANRTRDTK